MAATWRSLDFIILALTQGRSSCIYDWISKGAQPSESVIKLFKTSGLTERYERFKAGESLEVLLAEAKTAQDSRTLSPLTSQRK
jgi:small subunit ribosomal protein S16